MRIMALDVGDRRIGVALSDPTGLIASPFTTINREAERKDHERIARLVREQEVGRVVVGLPKTLRGEIGPQARKVLRFGDHLSRVVEVPIVYWDERHSTVDAEEIVGMRARGRTARGRLDEVAAAVFLQNYLDSLRLPVPSYRPMDDEQELQGEQS